jgi:hypothetical protein
MVEQYAKLAYATEIYQKSYGFLSIFDFPVHQKLLAVVTRIATCHRSLTGGF